MKNAILNRKNKNQSNKYNVKFVFYQVGLNFIKDGKYYKRAFARKKGIFNIELEKKLRMFI